MDASATVIHSSRMSHCWQACRAVGLAGLLAGSLDITAAVVEYRKSLFHLFQGIAGGALGMASFQGGLTTAALGAFFHFLIATAASAVFYLASRKLRFLVKHPFLSGLVYGVAVYIFMSFIVLPLSAYHTEIALPPMAELARGVITHICMVGLPISLVMRKYSV